MLLAVLAPLPLVAQRLPQDVERQEGAARGDAVLGNGRLTAVVALDGTVTALRWPRPSFFEHLHHATARALPPGVDSRTLPRLGAKASDGMVAAVLWDDGNGPRLWPLHAADWEDLGAQWATDTSRVLSLQRRGAGLTVTQAAWVHPDRDVLTLRLEVEPQAPLTRLAVVLLFHPAPSARYFPGWPVADVLMDDPDAPDPNGFAVAHDTVANAVVAVAPGPAQRRAALVAATPWKTQEGRDGRALLNALEPHTAVALAVGCDRQATAQVGAFDDGAGVLRPLDAWADAQDGVLQGNPVQVGDASAALLVELPVAGRSEVAFHVAMAGTPAAALEVLAHARATPLPTLREEADLAQQSLARDVALPATQDAAARTLALRSLMVLDALEDPQTGAVVASPTSQPMAAVDRPVDSAWVDLAHAHAARLARAARHRLWWATGQRLTADGESQPGTLPGARYGDGANASVVAAPWDGLALSLWADLRVVDRSLSTLELPDPTLPARALRDSTRRAVDALLTCVDPVTGWPCLAQAWDDPTPQQSLWQHLTVAMALRTVAPLLRDPADRERSQTLDAVLPTLLAALDARLQQQPVDAPPFVVALALGDGQALQEDPVTRTRLWEETLAALQNLLDQQDAPPMVLPTLVAWQLLVAARQDPDLLQRARDTVDRLVARTVTGTGALGLATGGGPKDLVQWAGAPSAAAHATAYLMLLERHGRQPPAALPLPDLDRCACPNAQAPQGTPSGLWFVVGAWVLARRVRRRGGSACSLPARQSRR